MESRTITITSAAHKHGNLNIRPCGKEFFPSDAFGSSCRGSSESIPITVIAKGLNTPIRTDIPTDKATGKPRWIFRER